MATLGVDAFKAKLVGGGARQNLFQVTCTFPSWVGGSTELAAFMIKAASLPGSTIGEIAVPFRGRKLKIAGDRSFDDWKVTVINDVNMPLRNAFEAWSNGINTNISNGGRTNPSSYMTDMRIDQLDRGGNISKSYIFRGCWPKVIDPIEMAYETEGIQDFGVTLAYQYWESTSTPISGAGRGASFGSGGGSGVSFSLAADIMGNL